MSQDFPPSGRPGPPGLNYQGPRRDYPQRDPAGLARNASIVLFILGGLIALLGVGNCAIAFTFSGEEILRQNQLIMPTTQASAGVQVSPLEMKSMLAVAGVVEALVGVGIMLLGSPVRRGRRWAITTSIVTICIIGGFALLMLVGSLLAGALVPPMLAMACVLVIPTALCGLLLKWLIQVMQAMRPAPRPYIGPPASGWPAPTPPPTWQPQPGPAPRSGSGYSPYVPPPGERPVRYGYAQAPAIPEPPAGDTPIEGSAPILPSAAGPDNSVDRAKTDEGSIPR